ncbi:APC family permease [Bittarella massiliensis (ex Durand et al. 2017)]|uniref:Amino acid permease n=1 Tax=Bittarella massiliensis (ex Durand et al. 2017) TaxID=1720313 RepID=A0AAW5KBE8_9FIRM|nr:amino acid permease [Bittarella massiliensis (ex Durand et al. 2017)]MBC2870066.1 amino acid permease [Bittarella massiliensis (ex Durand et al. 2017)]MCQ4950276.1 amino acid permease [Bittarella massiliensis (ex Durand et al. 2017)]
MNQTPNTTKAQALASEKTELKREVGLFGGVSVLGGIMIGSGIFYLGSIVLQRSGMSMGLALLVWALGGLVVLFSGICYAELGAMMPKAGGGYVYLREAYGERVAFMSGFSNFILGSSGSIAALAVAFPEAIASLVPLSPLACKAIAIGMIVLLSAINLFGIKLGSRIQNFFMILKLLPIVLIIVCGIFMGQQTPNLSLVPDPAIAGTPSLFKICGMVAFGVVATLWAYEGWTNLNTISEEIKNPKRNLPLAIILSIVGVMLIYVLFNFAIYRTLPYETITAMLASGDLFLGTAAANTLFGSAGKIIVGSTMIVAIFSALNGCVMVFPRTYYAMARDGAFFKSAAKLHPKYKTPVFAIVLSGVVSIVLVCMQNLSQLTSLVAFCGMFFNTMTFYAVIRLRKKYPDLERPYKVWGYPVMVVLVILITIGLLINTLVESPVTSIIGLSVPAVGLLLYELVFKKSREAVLAAQQAEAEAQATDNKEEA